MSLRDDIDDKMYDFCGYDLSRGDRKFLSDAILALPSGLVAVRDCGACEGGTKKRELCYVIVLPKDCPACNGTGRIERNLSVQEALEWAKMIAQYHVTMDYCVPVSEERVEVKK